MAEILASRDIGRQDMVGKLLCNHGERADTLDALQDERSRPGGSV